MRYAGINKNDVVDTAKGIAVSVWFQGCPFHCHGCHNPQTWDPEGGEEIDFKDLLKETLQAVSAYGVKRDVSILGGEPLAPYNREAVANLIKGIREQYPDIKIYLWTGYTYEYLIDNLDNNIRYILNNIDIMIDGPYKENLRDITLPLRGSSNQRILDLKGKGL